MTEKRFNEEFLEEMNEIKKEKPERVTVDDIIGLIKTDEPTDSVTLKKEAQLSICEKRLIELEKENKQLKKEVEDWKSNCLSAINENSILWNEIAIMREQGAKPSSAFEEYCSKFKSDLE